MNKYTIRHTTESDLAELMPLFDHSRAIMRNNGNANQWVAGYPSIEVITNDIHKKVSYVICEDGAIAGTFAFIIGRDPTYEYIESGSWLNDSRPYGTIHRIACAEGHHGIFETCIDWCRGQIPSLRIDTHADNRIMLHLITKHGFQHCGTIYIADGTPRQAFQIIDTQRLCTPLTSYIEQNILPQYDLFDNAHKQEHARTVIANSIELAQHYDVEINMVYTIAAYHDMGLTAGRERHHIVSAEIVRNDRNLRRWFDNEQIETMAQAVEDHRASADHAPRTIYGKIVAEADRDIEPLKIIMRTVQYGRNHYPEFGHEEQWQRAKEHLNEKYGRNGYLKLWLPESNNAAQLENLRNIIDEEESLREIFEKCYFFDTEK